MDSRDTSHLDTQYLNDLYADFSKVSSKLKEVSSAIREHEKYHYPLFPVSRTSIPVGTLLIEKNEMDNQWHYYATYLDMLVQCGLVAHDKVVTFQQSYKDPHVYCCLLAIDQDFTRFVYVPYTT